MGYKNYLERAKERDANLVKYFAKHPNMSQRALGKVFKISQARVAQIIRAEYKKKGEQKDGRNTNLQQEV